MPDTIDMAHYGVVDRPFPDRAEHIRDAIARLTSALDLPIGGEGDRDFERAGDALRRAGLHTHADRAEAAAGHWSPPDGDVLRIIEELVEMQGRMG